MRSYHDHNFADFVFDSFVNVVAKLVAVLNYP